MRGRFVLLYTTAVMVFSLSTGFLLGVNYTHHQNRSKTVTSSPSAPVKVAEAAPSENPAPEATTSEGTYTVKKGDTLYSIGKQFNIQWPVLAKFNNLSENAPLKEGQVLKIPSETTANNVQAHDDKITADQEEKDNLVAAQQYATAGTGQLAFRMNPVLVVQQSRLLAKYQFSQSDLYVEKSRDAEAGSAVVEVTHNEHIYTITLSAYQPNQGDKTVWTPTEVKY